MAIITNIIIMCRRSLLLNLPNELICYIAELCNIIDIISLMRCNHKLHNILTGRIYYYIKSRIIKTTNINEYYEYFMLNDTIRVRHGEYKWYYNNILQIYDMYRYGKIHGLCVAYHNSGLIRNIYNKVNGIIQGEYKQYYDCKGDKLYKCYMYRNGKKHGPFTMYYDNGQVCKIGNYYNGVYNGIIIWYDLDGRIYKKCDFQRSCLCNINKHVKTTNTT